MLISVLVSFNNNNDEGTFVVDTRKQRFIDKSEIEQMGITEDISYSSVL